jgi:hypothetical protein
MQLARFVRAFVPFVMLGLAVFVPGCSGQGAPPVDKETGKKIAADMKTAQRELRAERAEAKDSPNMKDMMKNRRRGGSESSGP